MSDELEYVDTPTKTSLPTTYTKKLGPNEKNFLARIEQMWYLNRRVMPSVADIAKRVNRPEIWVKNHFSNTEFIKALNSRGINAWETHFGAALTSEMIAVAVTVANPYDTRPTAEKLRGLDILPQQYYGWIQNNEYRELQRQLADNAMEDFHPEAVNALGRLLQKDDLGAVKFYMEITGRTQSPEVQNVKLAAQRLVEAVQRHVKDPEVLAKIGLDMSAGLGSDKEITRTERSLRGEE